MPAETAIESMAKRNGVLLATDAIQDPGNMGTIIRTAAWFGVNGLLAGKGSVDIFHPKTVRSTAGATGSLPYQTGRLEAILSRFENSGWKVLLLDGSKEAANINELDAHNKVILVVGNEANGIRPGLFTPERTAAQIQTKGLHQNVESLNAAIAASIAIYEFC